MIRFFSSIRLTFVLLVSMLILLWVGTILSLSREYGDAINLMNESLIYQWFFTAWEKERVLPIWFLLIFFTAGLLFFNTLVCSVTKQLATAIKAATLRQWAFFMIHLFFLMVLLCHGIFLVVGDKRKNIELFQGDLHKIGTLTLEVSAVTFIDNPDFLKLDPRKSRELMTREKFHRRANFAEITISDGDKPKVSGRVMMLSALKYGSMRVTLTKFVHGRDLHKGEIGINLTVTRNAFTEFFFLIYALMIISLVCFIVITWRPGGKGEIPWIKNNS